jgi:hypothetical protein
MPGLIFSARGIDRHARVCHWNSKVTQVAHPPVSRQKRRRVHILLREMEIDSLISKDFLKPERRHNHAAVENAVGAFICSTLGLGAT